MEGDIEKDGVEQADEPTTTKNRFNIGGLTSVVKKIDVNVSAVA